MIVIRFFRWTVNRLGGYNCLAWLLLAVAQIGLVQTLAEAVRGLAFGYLLVTALLGLLAGWGLATAKRVPGRLAVIIIIVLGVELAVFRVGRFEEFSFTLVERLTGAALQLWQQPFTVGAELAAAGQILLEAGSRVSVLLTRVVDWVTAIATGNPVYDPVAVALLWSVALWSVSSWAGWATRRLGRPFAALFPTGLVLAVMLAFYPRNVSSLFPLIGATLLLMGLTRYRLREQGWQANGIDYPDDLRLDAAIAVIAVTAALLSLANLVPSVSIWQVAARFTQSARLGQPLVESLGVRREVSAAADVLEPFRQAGLPQGHLLGSGPELSDQVALLIEVEQADPISPPPRYKWRSLTYDRYTGRGWRTGPTQPFSYAAGQATTEVMPPNHRRLRQNVEIVRSQRGRLYSSGDLLTANQPYHVEWRGPADPFGVTIESSRYQADSLVSSAGPTALRTATTSYPDWIEQRYISLPDQLPPRVLTLARDLTAGAPTPYDRAKAIERYLRQFPYSLDLPEPPRQRDMVDYFLFDLQQGYCDYYATAMVVLARAAGVPARLAVGYATGRYDAATGRYVVTEADAHSWPELYFPEYGWIAFEPTAAQPVSDRSPEAETPAPFSEGQAMSTGGERGFAGWYLGWTLAFLAGAALVAMSGATWIVVDGWRLRRLEPAAAITVLFGRLEKQSRGLAVTIRPGDTPLEFASALKRKMEEVAKSSRWASSFNEAASEVAWLTQLYVRTLYSSHPPQRHDQIRAIKIWQRLRRRLWLARLERWSRKKADVST